MKGSELYKELGALTKERERWEDSIPYVSSLLDHSSVKIQAKALWLLGEMGMAYPRAAADAVPAVVSFCDSPLPLLRQRALCALGRIGRGDFQLVGPYWADLFRFAADTEADVRMSFIWASENIAAGHAALYEDHMAVFAGLLYDENDRVRMEAPEFFRVIGKRRPAFVMPYLEQLRSVAATDENRVVRIHCTGAVNTVMKQAAAVSQEDRKDGTGKSHGK